MEWLEVAVDVEPEWQEALSQAFLDMGIQGVEVVDPDEFRRVLKQNRYLDYAEDGFIEGFGSQAVIKAYFPVCSGKEMPEEKLLKFFTNYGILPFPRYSIRIRDDNEWKDNWKRHYRTFHISERVVIKPSWESPIFSEEQIVIELDPGMAFGTGTHETTRMCASLIDNIVRGNERVLDLGCGTGILGIIAAKLGASEVVCVDVDDAACRTAEENIRNNRVDKTVKVVHGQLKNIRVRQYDIIVINIITDIILSLIPELRKYCTSRTNILLSGIIKERRNEVLEALKKSGYCVEQEESDGEWVAMRICIDF